MKLRVKFVLFTAVLSAMFSTVIVADRVTGVRSAMLDRTRDRVEYISSFLADVAGNALEAGKEERLKAVLESFAHFRQISYLRVSDARGKVLYRRAEPGIIIDGRLPDADIYEAADNIFDTRSDILVNGTRLGYIEMGVSLAGIREATESMMWRGIVVGLGFIALITLAVWVLALRLGRELNALDELAANINSPELPEVEFTPGTDTGKIAGTLVGLHGRLREEEARRKEAEKQRDEFYVMTVHDLKQPVAGLKGALDLILNPEEAKTLSAKVVEDLRKAAFASLDRLLVMIADVLNTAKLNDPENQVEKERLSLSELLRESAAENSTAVRAAGKKWSYSLPPEAEGAWLFADRDIIKRVLGNLVLNAIQYTPAGGLIKLGVRLKDKDRAAIYVSDEGEGIPENFRQEIFKKYSSMGKSSKNFGLGLAFCKLAADRHSAFLDVRSEVGKGTEISLVIPVSLKQQKEEAA